MVSQPFHLLLKAARVSDSFHSCQKGVGQKENPKCNYQTNTQPFKQFIFRDNSYTSRIILSRLMVKHIIKIIKQVNKYNNDIHKTQTQILSTHSSTLNHLS